MVAISLELAFFFIVGDQLQIRQRKKKKEGHLSIDALSFLFLFLIERKIPRALSEILKVKLKNKDHNLDQRNL
jgi:hypothetical protein